VETAQSCGVNEFTINTLNKTISILAWGEDYKQIEDLISKLPNLI